VRAETRHQLKQDKFSRATMGAAEATVHWSVEHKSKLIIGGIIAAVVVAAGLGGWYYLNLQDQKASVELSQAVRVLDAPLRPAGAPAQPGFPSFTSSKERATEAHQKFQVVVDKYPHTRSSDVARYFLGLTSADLGDNAVAERELRAVASSRNDDLSALAKFALASVYRNNNRNKEAIDLYKKLMEKPTRTVGKVMAEMELAAAYMADQQPLEAKRVYEQVQKENPAGPAGQMAAAKLQEMK
jgi:predicted negative regulator of RcsB-dependent stress response